MPLFEFGASSIAEVDRATFEELGLLERTDIQRLLRMSIGVIDRDLYVLTEEFEEWEEVKRRIDLLCIDRQSRLVVVELKRTIDGGHMELQALRYAAMVSTLTFEKAVEVHEGYLRRNGDESDARTSILTFLGFTGDSAHDITLSSDVRIVLVSADFSRELTTTVMWLNDRDLDIRCIRLRPYRFCGRTLVDVQQVLPLPEVSQYQVRLKEKAQEKKAAERTFNPDFSKYDLTIGQTVYPNLWKRMLGFRILQTALRNGIDPQELAARLGRLVPTWLIALDGTYNAAEFAELASQITTKFGKYQLSRFFCEDEDLLHIGDKTLAITNQWSIKDIPALQSIAEAWPQLGLSFIRVPAAQ